MNPQHKIHRRNLFYHLNVHSRIIVSLIIAVIVSVVSFFLHHYTVKSLVIGWISFNVSLIITSWITVFKTSSEELEKLADLQDTSLPVAFVIVLLSLCFSLFETMQLFFNKNVMNVEMKLHSGVLFLGIALSWIVLHTIFTFRYAHLYFMPDEKSKALSFPSETPLDYLDFVYFSFVIGMTFQVSDVVVNSKRIRKFVLLHSIIAFVFNTIILALTINAIAGLR